MVKVSPGNLRAFEKLGQKGSLFNYGLTQLLHLEFNSKCR